jgi:quinol-cytochrome oxidoreductase complex cytochrome b subunit
LFVFTISSSRIIFRGMNFSPIARFVYWRFIANFLLLTWLGRCPAETPYTEVALFCTVVFFVLISAIAAWSHVVTYLYLRADNSNVLRLSKVLNL